MGLISTIVNSEPLVGIEAGANLTGKEGYYVKLSNGKAFLCDTLGEQPFGVLAVGGASGTTVSVAVMHRAKVVAGAALSTIGTKLMTSAAGKAVAATSGKFITGVSLEVATGDGHRVDSLITNAGAALA